MRFQLVVEEGFIDATVFYFAYELCFLLREFFELEEFEAVLPKDWDDVVLGVRVELKLFVGLFYA